MTYPPPYALPSIVGVHSGTTEDDEFRKGGSLVSVKLRVELDLVFLVELERLDGNFEILLIIWEVFGAFDVLGGTEELKELIFGKVGKGR